MNRVNAVSRGLLGLRRIFLCVSLILLLLSISPAAPVRASSILNIFGPPGSGQFGLQILSLLNGNLVVSDPYFSKGTLNEIGAVYLYNGATHALISTLTGSQSGDYVGLEIFGLSNGNYVVSSVGWSNGSIGQVGAVTWCSGITGCQGAVSTANSLVGSQTGDEIGDLVTPLKNGNYLVLSSIWSNGSAYGAGALTWCSGTSGCKGAVSPTNSLVGSQAWDGVGGPGSNGLGDITELPDGNYLVPSPGWANGPAARAGAVTWCSGSGGCHGAISAANSLVGSHVSDGIGSFGFNGTLVVLSNGNYVVPSPSWTNGTIPNAGAFTWCSKSGGCRGVVSAANSQVGTQSGDGLQSFAVGLSNGNYVVSMPYWTNNGANMAGAVIWCGGAGGCTGAVSVTNSLVGSQPNDQVGRSVVGLSNGNYLVDSMNWTGTGAVTWCSGSTGCRGAVSAANSLVGSPIDGVGASVVGLTNGNYVVTNSGVFDPDGDLGQVIWCDRALGCKGVVSATDGLVGSQAGDNVGHLVVALANGNYVVVSPDWSNGSIVAAGAVTWCSAKDGCRGAVSATNSLVGSQAGDRVGSGNDQILYGGLVPLDNGSYVVESPDWANGSISAAGSVTWCSGTGGCIGAISATNSLVGTHPGDKVGQFSYGSVGGHGSPPPLVMDPITKLADGYFVVNSPSWNGGAPVSGAITLCSGVTGCNGPVSAANSLAVQGGVTALADGNYVVRDPIVQTGTGWDFGTSITLCSVLIAEPFGPANCNNSIQGSVWTYDAANRQLVAGDPDKNSVTFFIPNFTFSIASGDWNNPSTWNGGVPADGSPVTIRVGTSVTLTSGSAVGMDLTIQPGGSLTMISASLTLTGDFTNQGIFNPGSGTLVFTGSGQHTLDANSPTAFNNLTVGIGAILTDSLPTDLFSVRGKLFNQGTIRKSQALSQLGLYRFGLTGAQVDVSSLGGVTTLQVDRVDQNLPGSSPGYGGSISTQTGAYWTISPEAGLAPYTVNLGLPHQLGDALTFVCQPAAQTWDCDRSGGNSAIVWRNGLAQVAGNWTVGWQPSLWVYAPFVGN